MHIQGDSFNTIKRFSNDLISVMILTKVVVVAP